MERTKNRPLVQGIISNKAALIFAFALAIIGTISLYSINILTVFLSLLGLFFYIVIYTILFKRKFIYGTLLGSISGSMPPVIGYVAVTNKIDLGAILLFLILTTWQMPHSYAIGIFRFDDYKNANISILPVKKGFDVTKWHMLVYIILFAVMNALLSIYDYTGIFYLVISLALSLAWLYLCIKGFNPSVNNQVWAKKMFFFSILCITVLSIMMAINPSHA